MFCTMSILESDLWDKEKYDELFAKREGELNHRIDSDYFPKYRV